jgi:RNA polymerase sigma factor (TIGR02999 family)
MLGQVTQLLIDWSEGDQAALDRLMPIVHDELYRIAQRHMRRERAGHTLQATALINEAYLKLVNQQISWENRAHFFGIAARLMRQILVDHARGRNYAKRGGKQIQVSLAHVEAIADSDSANIIALDDALKSLAAIDPQQCRIVELKFFGGLTINEIVEVIGVGHSTVERDWNMARAWLRREMAAR